MKTNVGSLDRSLRVIGGATAMGLAATGLIGGWGWFGAVPLLTGLVRFCPVYSLLGINSCKLPAGGTKSSG